jgi:hypothetical protein
MLLIQKRYAPSCGCLQEISSQLTSMMALCAQLMLHGYKGTLFNRTPKEKTTLYTQMPLCPWEF